MKALTCDARVGSDASIRDALCRATQVAYREAEALRRQEELIAEEEEDAREQRKNLALKAFAEKEKRAKKKVRLRITGARHMCWK